MKLKGLLCQTPDGKSFVRQYTVDGEFTDYYILHDDLNIEIDDSSACIKQHSNGLTYIDYTDEVLGK
jgi:hypothetical protein